MPELPNCPSQLVDRVIVDSVREFCRRTGILSDNESFTVAIGTRSYSITPPTDMEVLDISRVNMSTSLAEIPIYTESSAMTRIDETEEGTSILYYTWSPQSSINIYPIPEALMDDTLEVYYTYQPERTIQTIPDEIFNRWAETKAFKVKYMVKMQAGKAWSNPQYVAANRTEWYRLLRDAARESNKMNANFFDTLYSLDQG